MFKEANRLLGGKEATNGSVAGLGRGGAWGVMGTSLEIATFWGKKAVFTPSPPPAPRWCALAAGRALRADWPRGVRRRPIARRGRVRCGGGGTTAPSSPRAGRAPPFCLSGKVTLWAELRGGHFRFRERGERSRRGHDADQSEGGGGGWASPRGIVGYGGHRGDPRGGGGASPGHFGIGGRGALWDRGL